MDLARGGADEDPVAPADLDGAVEVHLRQAPRSAGASRLAAIQEAVGEDDDIATRDGEPLGSHLPRDTAAVIDVPRGPKGAFCFRTGGIGDAGEGEGCGGGWRARDARLCEPS